MRLIRIVYVLLVCCVGAVLFAQRQGQLGQPQTPQAQDQQSPASQAELRNQIMQKLQRIEDLYFKYLSFSERREAVRLLDEIMELVKGFSDTRPSPKPSSAPTPMPTPIPMLSDAAFKSLLAQVGAVLNESDKTATVLSIGRKTKITAAQVLALVKAYTFDSGKFDLIKSIYGNVLDPENLAIVLPEISNSFTRADVQEFLSK